VKNFLRTLNSYLARRIGIYVILVSTLLSVFTSGLQIYTEFKREKNTVYEVLNQIEKTQVSNIAARVWVLDKAELTHTLNSLLELRAIKYVAVYEESELLASAVYNINKRTVVREYPLVYFANNMNNNIGHLVVKASLEEVYQHIFDRAVFIVLTNLIKTFIVAIFILFIFYKLVTRHISDISSFLLNENSASNNKSLSLNRNFRKEDELDQLVDSINAMKVKLRYQFDEIIQQKQHLSQTLNSIGDAVITTDIYGDITRMNPIAEKLTGWKNVEALGQSIKVVFPIIDATTQEEIENPIEQVIKNGNIINLSNHTTLLSKNGEQYQIADSAAPIKDDNGNILGMVLVFNDVTEQYELRRQAKLNEKKYKILATVAPVGLFYTDVNGSCLYVNEKWSDISGLSFDEALGNGWIAAIHPDDKDKVFTEWDNFSTNNHPFKLEYRFQHSEESKWVLGQAIAEEDDNGNVIGYVGTITDITERKEAEYALNRSQKMDALGKLTGGIAHDYNNMLGVILGYSELLESSLSDDEKLKKYVAEINAAALRGAKLTSKLLSFSRQKKSNSETIDLNEILRNSANMLQKTLTVNVKLTFDLFDNLDPIKVDVGDLENAVINLCINASHAMEGHGEIIIKTSDVIVDGSKYVCLRLSDTGCGITEEDLDKVFDPFFTTKGEQGTGLGLSQVYSFVERSHGRVDVSSILGEGTTFSLFFPVYNESTSTKEEAENVIESKSFSGKEKILIVDDEPQLLSLCEELLCRHGYDIYTAESGEQALKILDEESIELVLTDVIMPNMDGYELAKIIKNKFPTIKIQMVSGYTGDRDNNSDNTILTKPYQRETLLKTLRALLDS